MINVFHLCNHRKLYAKRFFKVLPPFGNDCSPILNGILNAMTFFKEVISVGQMKVTKLNGLKYVDFFYFCQYTIY